MPFRNAQACADTNILYYFYAIGRLDLVWALFPDGIWIDPAVLREIREVFGADLEEWLGEQDCPFQIERQFEDRHYLEMAEIKARRPGLKHADIVTIVIAGKQGITCLSADDAVRKTCEERGVSFARHVGCLDEAVCRGLLTQGEALALLDALLEEGLYLPQSLIKRFREKWSEE